MESDRKAIALTLLGGCIAFVVGGVSLAADHVVLGLLLIVAGVAVLAVAVWLLRPSRKRLVISPEARRVFDRAGPFMGEPPRYGSLREPRHADEPD